MCIVPYRLVSYVLFKLLASTKIYFQIMHFSINHKVQIPLPLFQLSTSHNYKAYFFVFLSFRRTTGQAWKLLTRKWFYFGLEQKSLFFVTFPSVSSSTVYYVPPSVSSSFLDFKFETNFWPNLLHCCISTGDAVYPRPLLSMLVYSRFIF
jgi:hypothetical protein